MGLERRFDRGRARSLDQVDQDRRRWTIPECEAQGDREEGREPVDPEHPRRLSVKITKSHQVKLEKWRRFQHIHSHSFERCGSSLAQDLELRDHAPPFPAALASSASCLAPISVSSRKWRPVSETKTSSRLTCRVVRASQGVDLVVRARPGWPESRGGVRRRSTGIHRFRHVRTAPSPALGTNPPVRAGRCVVGQCELDNVFASEAGDQLVW